MELRLAGLRAVRTGIKKKRGISKFPKEADVDDVIGDLECCGPLEAGEAGLLLMGAIGLDDQDRARSWLALGLPELIVSGVDPLAKAAEWGAARCVKMLIAKGWDWRRPASSGLSAIETACASGSLACVEAMLGLSVKGVDLPVWSKALRGALRSGRVDCAKAILDRSCFEDFDPAESAEAMALAIDSGSSGALPALLGSGWPAEMRVGRVDPAPEFLPEAAGFGKSLDMESWARAASELSALPRSLSALGLACLSGRWSAARELARRGADIHGPLRGGATPLMLCARGQSAQSVSDFLEAGADPNARDSKGWTPLMWAAGYDVSVGNASVTALLLRAGADPSATGPGKVGVLDLFARRYESQADVEAICERMDPRPALSKARSSSSGLPVPVGSLKAMERWAKHWHARDEADRERREIESGSSASGSTLRNGRARM